MKTKTSFALLLLGTAVLAGCHSTDVDKITGEYNYVISTQTIGAGYKFTDKPVLVETSERILQMGANSLKCSLSPINGPQELESGFMQATPVEIAKGEPSIKAILGMNFKNYLFWVTTPGVDWTDGMSEEESRIEYDSMYALADYLLSEYKDSGKNFYLGHWEGDWLLLGSYSRDQERIDPVRIQGMIDWMNVRQKAVETARSRHHSDTHVYNYIEVNRVMPAMLYGFDRISNKVLPEIDVDYVSYSSYEAISEDIPSKGTDYAELEQQLLACLDYVEAHLKPKKGIPGRRVFIGEYGYDLKVTGNSPEQQALRSLYVIRAGIKWGCPFILYWEMFDNEGTGYWMVDRENREQPVYWAHHDFYVAMKQFVREYATKNGKAPEFEEFQSEAIEWIDARIATLK